MRAALVLIAGLLVANCSSSTGTASSSPRPEASIRAVGCASYPVLSGSQPKWLVDAGANNNPDIPYVIASPQIAAGFLFGFPLRAGHPVDPINKILWVVAKPRNGWPLVIRAHPTGASEPIVMESFPDNAGPGEIYPSGVDVPTSGCWHFDLQWNGNRAQVELDYS